MDVRVNSNGNRFLHELGSRFATINHYRHRLLSWIVVRVIIRLITTFCFPTARCVSVVTYEVTRVSGSIGTNLINGDFQFTRMSFAVEGQLVEGPFTYHEVRNARFRKIITLRSKVEEGAICTSHVVQERLAMMLRMVRPLVRDFSSTNVQARRMTLAVRFRTSTINIRIVTFASIR